MEGPLFHSSLSPLPFWVYLDRSTILFLFVRLLLPVKNEKYNKRSACRKTCENALIASVKCLLIVEDRSAKFNNLPISNKIHFISKLIVFIAYNQLFMDFRQRFAANLSCPLALFW